MYIPKSIFLARPGGVFDYQYSNYTERVSVTSAVTLVHVMGENNGFSVAEMGIMTSFTAHDINIY